MNPSKTERAESQSDVSSDVVIAFGTDGTARCLWTEAISLREFGQLEIQRATTIEFNNSTQLWEVRLKSEPEVIAFSHLSRETCLDWERNVINALVVGGSSVAS